MHIITKEIWLWPFQFLFQNRVGNIPHCLDHCRNSKHVYIKTPNIKLHSAGHKHGILLKELNSVHKCFKNLHLNSAQTLSEDIHTGNFQQAKQKARNRRLHFCIFLHWWLQWWVPLMLLFLCIENFAKLQDMVALFRDERSECLQTVEEKISRHAQEGTKTSRELVIQFNADVADGMPWTFVPAQREVRVKPGESALAFYTAQNFSPKAITGVSTYNVTPMKAAIYFNKIQCFCFEEQRLLPGEKIDMPVFFYVDPEFDTDPKMNGINNLILSYTFFKVEDEET